MNEVYISKYRLVEDAKPHYVYTVEVVNDGVHHSIEKRYSAFHALHREVRKFDFPKIYCEMSLL